jgi:hypothetical protein
VGYPYEDLNDKQFEDLVVEIMRKLFGQDRLPTADCRARGPFP